MSKYINNIHNNILLHISSKEINNGFIGTLRCFGGRAQFSSLLLFTLSPSSSPLPLPPSSRHSFVPNAHNVFDNSLHFPTEKSKRSGGEAFHGETQHSSSGGGPGLSQLSDCQHPKPGAPRKSGKSLNKVYVLKKIPLV